MWMITEDGPKDVVWVSHKDDAQTTQSQVDQRIWARMKALQDEIDDQKEKTHQLRLLLEDLYAYRDDSLKLARLEAQLGLDS
jgi:hypothetical protein